MEWSTWYNGCLFQKYGTFTGSRTRTVLEYTITLPAVTNQQEWLIEKITANGLSYSQRIKEMVLKILINLVELKFRIRTKAEDTMDELIKDRFE